MHDVDDLMRYLIAVWSGMQQTVIDEAIGRWRERPRACLKVTGGHFEHLLRLSDMCFSCFQRFWFYSSYLTLLSDADIHQKKNINIDARLRKLLWK
jgi:hypothetical protein